MSDAERKFSKEQHKKAMRDSIGLEKGTPIRDTRQAQINDLLANGPKTGEAKHKKQNKHRKEK